MASFRGVLLGLFFATVGFSADFGVVAARPRAALAATLGLVAAKAAALVPLGLFFRLPQRHGRGAALGYYWRPRGNLVLSRWGSPRLKVLDASTATTIDDGRRAQYVPHARLQQLFGDRWFAVDRLEAAWLRRSRRARDDAAVGRAVKNAQGELVVV